MRNAHRTWRFRQTKNHWTHSAGEFPDFSQKFTDIWWPKEKKKKTMTSSNRSRVTVCHSLVHANWTVICSRVSRSVLFIETNCLFENIPMAYQVWKSQKTPTTSNVFSQNRFTRFKDSAFLCESSINLIAESFRKYYIVGWLERRLPIYIDLELQLNGIHDNW